MRQLFLLVICFLVFSTELIYAQNKRTIEGYVLDIRRRDSLSFASVVLKGTKIGTIADEKGYYKLSIPKGIESVLEFSHISYQTLQVKVDTQKIVNANLELAVHNVSGEAVKVTGEGWQRTITMHIVDPIYSIQRPKDRKKHKDKSKRKIVATGKDGFMSTRNVAFPIFTVNSSRSSYPLLREYLNQDFLPNERRIREQELINYFDYQYDYPTNSTPLAIHTEVATCPWNKDHYLLKLGLQSKKIDKDSLPSANLVFFVDMYRYSKDDPNVNKIKAALKYLAGELRAQDKISIVIYGYMDGLLLPPTSGVDKEAITNAIEKISDGEILIKGRGLKMPYAYAAGSFIKGGNNRVIIIKNGSDEILRIDQSKLPQLIEENYKWGISLSVLYWGHNYLGRDDFYELVRMGGGNYECLDPDEKDKSNLLLMKEFSGTSFIVAKDVQPKIQFNPAYIQGYRQIASEIPKTVNGSINSASKSGIDIEAEYTATLLYELIPSGQRTRWLKRTDRLNNKRKIVITGVDFDNQLLIVRLLYRQPGNGQEAVIEKIVENKVLPFEQASDDFRFAASVASFGMILRLSDFRQKATFEKTVAIAEDSKGRDENGSRDEMIGLMRKASQLASGKNDKTTNE